MLLNLILLHDLDGKSLASIFMHAEPYQAEGTLTQSFTEHVSRLDIAELLELLVVIHGQSSLLRETGAHGFIRTSVITW